ncbi:MAG: NB-ARC domain-containing protein [Pseudonocardiaceae bacterium]
MTRELAPVDAAAPDAMRVLAEKLRECMGKAGYVVLRDLAQAANLAHSTVSDALSGGRTPTLKTVSALLKACDVAPNQSWARLQEAAKTAEKQWRQAAHPVKTPGDPRSVPGIFSIRPPTGALPPRVRGRDELLNSLGGLLAAPRPALQVLHGLGGCGKTTIALEFARCSRERGQPVFWVSAHQRDQITTAMREIAREIGVPEEQVEEAWSGRGSAPDLLWRHLDAAVTPWLLVIDEADEPGLLAAAGGEPGDGAGWVRPSVAGVTVITTRVGSPEVWGSQAERHQIGVLNAEDAADVLIDRAGHAGSHGDARALADRLGGLPLALVSAGTYLGRTTRGGGLLRRTGGHPARITTFDSYQRELGDLGTDLLDQGLNQPVDTEHLERLYRRLVGRTWEISLDLLEAQGISHARGLMRLMSCFASSAMPVDLINVDTLAASGALPASSVLDDVDRALEALVNLHLLDTTESGELTTVPHGVADPPLPCLIGPRLVLEATAARLPLSARDAVWRAAADLVKVAASPAPEEARNWDWWQLVAPHLQSAVATVPDHDERTLVHVLNCGLRCFAYLNFSNRSEAASAFADVLFARAAVLDADHPVRLATRHRRTLFSTASHAEGEIEYRDILDRQTRVLSPDHPDTLITDHEWAATLICTRGSAEAEPEVRRVAQTRSRLFGPADPYTLISRGKWADLLAALDRDAEAEAERRVMVEDCRRDRGEFDHYTLLQRAYLANLMNQRGHSEESAAEFRYLTEHCGVGEPMDSSHLPTFTRHQMAHILDDKGRFADAEVEYRAVLADLADSGSERREDYRHLSRCLARNLLSQSRHDESLSHLANLITSCDDLAADNPFLLSLRHQYGEGLGKIGRHAEAESEMSAVLDIRARTVDADDSVTLQERHCRAHSLEKLGRAAEAEVELREVAATFRHLVGAEDQRARKATWCHAMTLFKNDRLSDALPEFETCLAAELGALSSDHRDVLMSRRRIAEVRFRLKFSTEGETVAEFDSILPKLIEYDGENGSAVKEMRTFLTKLGHSHHQGH